MLLQILHCLHGGATLTDLVIHKPKRTRFTQQKQIWLYGGGL